jgi:hypothetical protein
VLDASALDVGAFGIGEILDLSRAVDVDPGRLGAVLTAGDTYTKARVALGLAWLIARRREPELTYQDVLTWELEIRGAEVAAPADPPPAPAPDAGAPRARPRRERRGSRDSGGSPA